MVKEIEEKEFEKNILKNNKITLIDFFATWCEPCRMLAPILEEVSNIKKEVEFCKINVEKNVNLATKYNVEFVPTMIIFKNGKEIGRINGMLDKTELTEQIEKYI